MYSYLAVIQTHIYYYNYICNYTRQLHDILIARIRTNGTESVSRNKFNSLLAATPGYISRRAAVLLYWCSSYLQWVDCT